MKKAWWGTEGDMEKEISRETHVMTVLKTF